MHCLRLTSAMPTRVSRCPPGWIPVAVFAVFRNPPTPPFCMPLARHCNTSGSVPIGFAPTDVVKVEDPPAVPEVDGPPFRELSATTRAAILANTRATARRTSALAQCNALMHRVHTESKSCWVKSGESGTATRQARHCKKSKRRTSVRTVN